MQIGILLALLSAALFGASTPLAKMILGNVDLWMLAALLYLGAGFGPRLSTFPGAFCGCPLSKPHCAARMCRGSPP
jgi:drug/metabolite transporter (DMT)-like permease